MQVHSVLKVAFFVLVPQALSAAVLSGIAGLPEPSLAMMVTVGLGLILVGGRRKRRA